MRAFSILGLCSLALLFAGCEAVSNRVEQRFKPVAPQVKDYAKPSRDVFEAAQHVFKTMDFVVTRAGQAQGVMEAHSRLLPGAEFGSHRQFVFKVRFTTLDPAVTRVTALLQRDEDDSAAAGANSEDLSVHGLYDSFFAALQQQLGGAEPIIGPSEKPLEGKD